MDKNGDEAYFFRASESDCNGYKPRRLTGQHSWAYYGIGL